MRSRFSPEVRAASSSPLKSLQFGEGFAARHLFGPAGLEEAEPLVRVGQFDAHLGDIGVLEQAGAEFVGGFGDQHDADVQPREFRRGGPLEERDQVHPFLHAGIGFFAGRDELLGEVDYQGDAPPFLFLLGDVQEEPAEQGRQVEEITRGPGGAEVSVLDAVIDFQPLEEAFLHVGGAERQPVADVVEEQAGALGEEAADEESLERDVVEVSIILHGKQVKDVAVEDEERIGAAVPPAGEFEGPAFEREASGGGGGGGNRCCGFRFHGLAKKSPKSETRSPNEGRHPQAEQGLSKGVACLLGRLWICTSDFGFGFIFIIFASGARGTIS